MTRAGLVAALVWATIGCAATLAGTGRHSDVVSPGVPRDRVVETLGPPARICPQPGCWNEIYAVFGKYPDDQLEFAYGELDIDTLFLSEALFTPIEIAHGGYQSLTHGSLVVQYCQLGKDGAAAVTHYEAFASEDVDEIAGRVCRPEDSTGQGNLSLLRQH